MAASQKMNGLLGKDGFVVVLYHASKQRVEFPEVRKTRYKLSALNCLTYERSEILYDRKRKK